MAIQLTDLTNGSVNKTDPEKPIWEGTAIFDVLVQSVNANIEIQFEAGRITGADYAKAYVNGLQACMNQAMQYLLQKPIIEADLLIKDKQVLDVTKGIELKEAQKVMLVQQTATEVQNTAIKAYENTVLQKDQHDIALKQIEKSTKEVLMLTSQNSMIQAQTAEKEAQTAMLVQQTATEVQNTAIKAYENTVLQKDQHDIALKQIEKSTKEAIMLTSQNNMIQAQTAEIAPNALKQRSVQDGQVAQMNAEVNYTNSKKTVMEQSRIDNLALEALKAQMTNLATVGAGGLTPSATDFSAANELRKAIYGRARGGDLPEISFTAGSAYTKAT